jgi:glycosyltransferase involved in cell wall biosynthesis
MIVNYAVPGKFHYFNYLKYISSAGIIGRCYYSHKWGEAERFGLSSDVAVNLWLETYLVQAHGRLLGDRFASIAHPIYAGFWSRGALARWQPADLLHVMAHGYALSIIGRARADGGRVLAEPVNTHPANQRKLLAQEANRWGLSGRGTALDAREHRIVEEIDRADAVLVPSETVRRSFVERGVDTAKIVKIPYAANLSRFFPRQPSELPRERNGPLRVVCVGAVGLRKGQLNLLEACSRLGEKVVQLTLVGPILNEVAPLCRRYAGRFRHVLRIANTELRTLLLEHDVFVLPSLEEGLAVSICEAMACGLAIVTTKESGGEEIIVDGENGLFIESASIDHIVERLQYLYDHRDIVEKLGMRAAETTKHYLNWESYADRLMDVYRNIISLSPGSDFA